ncbi:MAG: serine hydrolase domain-containing protein [Pseudomonadota bacterium]
MRSMDRERWCACFLLFLFEPAFSANANTYDPVSMDANSLEPLVDTAMAEGMAKARVPGAIVAIVKDGEILLAKGYGSADLAGAEAARADTPFRVASLSKLVTATAALRLAAQGRLDLHTDLEDYLDFPLRRDFPDAITAHHVMTHTSGLEITDIADAARSAESVLSLDEVVREQMVGQSHAPGEIFAYSNHGFALLGLAIERITGQPFQAAMQDLVLDPLEMTGSSFAQPLPAILRNGISQSYSDPDDPRPLTRDYSLVAPADALVASADDMARFMLAQLEGHAQLETGVLETMHRQQYAPYPTRYGMAYAWHEDTLRGHRVLEHSGGQLGFASYMALIPEHGFGYFIAQNLREASLRNEPLNAILESYFPRITHKLPAAIEPPRRLTEAVAEYTGYYVSAEYPRHSFERLLYELAFLGRDVVVEEPPACVAGNTCRPDALAINGSDGRYYEFAEDTFQHPSAWWATAAFHRDEHGNIDGLFLDRAAYTKRPAWRLPALQRLAFLLTFVLAGIGAIAWPLLARRKKNVRGAERTARRALTVCASVTLLTMLLLTLFLRIYAVDEIQMDYGLRVEAWLLLIMADVLKIAAAAAAAIVAVALIRQRWSLLARLYAVLLSAAMLHAAWLLHVSNVTLLL